MSRHGSKPLQLAHYPEVKPIAVLKEMTALDEHAVKFIGLSPLCMLASTDDNGVPDVSPRGGAPGFVHVVDEHTIFLPDRPGNNRLDSLRNVLAHPGISLIFLIPGVNETLRIKGHASIVSDAARLVPFEENGKVPRSLLQVRINSAFLHCAKALMRSQLWEPSSIQPRSVLPSMGQMLKDQTRDPAPVEPESEMLKRYRADL